MPKRILHVVGGMNRGGVETWLMHILRHTERKACQHDFLVHTDQKCAYDDEIQSLGSKIIPCLHPSRPWSYAGEFKRLLRLHGPYDIVHSHVHLYSGLTLLLAKQVGVPGLIAHSHNDTLALQASAGLFRRLYQTLMVRFINRYATAGLACSRLAATALFGPSWEEDGRWRVLNYGIDLTPFKTQIDSEVLRAELGIPSDAFVIGHVGRFVEQKNHTFLVEIAAEFAQREKNFRLLLIGDGPLRPGIEQQIASAGLLHQAIFPGVRADVPMLMMGVMDLFLFPSLFEGLGLVLIEAQAAGLPCVFSDVIPKEANLVSPLIRRLSLSKSAGHWAETILEVKRSKPMVTRKQALALAEKSSFNIIMGINELERIYEGVDRSIC